MYVPLNFELPTNSIESSFVLEFQTLCVFMFIGVHI